MNEDDLEDFEAELVDCYTVEYVVTEYVTASVDVPAEITDPIDIDRFICDAVYAEEVQILSLERETESPESYEKVS